ncbi:DUF2059 domain-containing protein, partial [Hansschlegelia beijingensis]
MRRSTSPAGSGRSRWWARTAPERRTSWRRCRCWPRGAACGARPTPRFSDQELMEIKTFYETPTGAKLVKALPGVLQESYDK